MKLSTSLLAPVLAVAALAAASAQPVQAQVSLILTPGVQAGTVGQVLVFSGTIQNLGSTPVFLNGDQFTPSVVNGLTFDDSPFILNGPSELLAAGDPLASYTGQLFDVTVNSAGLFTTPTYQILGGGDAFASDILAAAPFQVAAAPEPSALVPLCLGAIFIVGLGAARRRQAARS